VVVPTRELGVQTVMLVYKLFGGSVNTGIPGDPTNMFAYSGPRGIRVHYCPCLVSSVSIIRLHRKLSRMLMLEVREESIHCFHACPPRKASCLQQHSLRRRRCNAD
jgi:hypothetical protein